MAPTPHLTAQRLDQRKTRLAMTISRGSKPSGFAEDAEGGFRRAFCLGCASIVARVEPWGQIFELIADDTNDALFALSFAGAERRRRAESGVTAVVAIHHQVTVASGPDARWRGCCGMLARRR
jgi:hypothetical protein